MMKVKSLFIAIALNRFFKKISLLVSMALFLFQKLLDCDKEVVMTAVKKDIYALKCASKTF